jgi:glycosyltransferase involved in cell wall biosynthesis
VILNRTYYALKPLLPLGLRLPIRRWWARRLREAHSRSWPIDEHAGVAPAGWPGWPEGKRFAFILTHDVEGYRGVSRVGRLAELDRVHGFRSSFNFVPEDYRVPPALRENLEQAGFEVGVHGFKHDGKLYSSKASFARHAAGINRYFRDWNVSGFRSPSTHHRLGWLHQLKAEYDASTFDTDPFEPEPDGYGTIFPFWVPGPGGSGYVELPYTLPQDSTLFVLLQEPDIRIWQRKLDWIASHGGMALVIVHPDYVCFEGKPAIDEYPVARYEELLRYVRQKYENQFWATTLREVARYYRSAIPADTRNTRRRICMLAYTRYASDGRVRRCAEALAKRGDHVDVVALQDPGMPDSGELNGVRVFPLLSRQKNERSKWQYAARILRFSLASSAFLTRRHRQVRYDLVHVHNIPDFLVFAAWYPKLTGTKIILDIHDLVPELFANKFGARGGLFPHFLKRAEKAAAAFSDHVIISNHLWYGTVTGRSVPKTKCSVYINHIDSDLFRPHPRTRNERKLVIVFPGSFQWHQGLDIAIEAFARIKPRLPDAEFHLYGSGQMESNLRALANRLGLDGTVRFCGTVPLDDIPHIIANADLGIVPKRADTFGNEAYSTKIMEFMSQGVPVIASRTKIDTYYFDDSQVRFFPSGDAQALAAAIVELAEHADLRETLIANGREYATRNSWNLRKRDYLALVDSLTIEPFE